MSKTTEQASGKKKNTNPSGKGGFGDNPQNRNPGGWKKEHSISYQYNLIMRMSAKELKKFMPETVAQQIALVRVRQAITENGLNDTKEITDRTEGKAHQTMDVSITDPAQEILKKFDLVEGEDAGKASQT